MLIDHIFIFSDTEGSEADLLVAAGFAEGSSRIHPGQGTRNRKFYFYNFFLEFLWVHDEDEIKRSAKRALQQLWQRSQHKQNGMSPLGLCLRNTKGTDALFQNADSYQPDYFPDGMTIATLANEAQPMLPWTFRLPFRNALPRPDEPREHPNGVRRLDQAILGIPSENAKCEFVSQVGKMPGMAFCDPDGDGEAAPILILDFDERKQNQELFIPTPGGLLLRF